MSGSVEAHGSYRAISGGSVAEAVASILPPTNSRIPPLKKAHNRHQLKSLKGEGWHHFTSLQVGIWSKFRFIHLFYQTSSFFCCCCCCCCCCWHLLTFSLIVLTTSRYQKTIFFCEAFLDLTGAATETINLEASRRFVTVDGLIPQKRDEKWHEIWLEIYPPPEKKKGFPRNKRSFFVLFWFLLVLYMGVSENNGTPQIIHFNRVFPYFHHPFWGYHCTIIFGNPHINVIYNPGGWRAPGIRGGMWQVPMKRRPSSQAIKPTISDPERIVIPNRLLWEP